MNIHEYQGKDVLRKYGVATPRGFPCRSPEEAAEAATRLGGRAWVVKAQIHAGGRGKGGGIRRAWSVAEVQRHAGALLGMPLKTGQTGPEGRMVKRLLVEEGIEIECKFYLGLAVDPDSGRVALMASRLGGANAREKIHRIFIDPGTGLKGIEADAVARGMGLSGKEITQARTLMQNLHEAFDASDASLAEIDPLVLTRDGRLVALDAHFDFDANALFRQPEIVAMRDGDEEQAAATGDGIGCLANGAGLAMATMDMIKLHGGTPAGFRDVGDGASAWNVAEAFAPMLRDARLQGILVNIVGGIVRCDEIARGVVVAAREAGQRMPLVVRMKGVNEALARTVLADSGLSVIHADGMAEAAELVVTAARWKA